MLRSSKLRSLFLSVAALSIPLAFSCSGDSEGEGGSPRGGNGGSTASGGSVGKGGAGDSGGSTSKGGDTSKGGESPGSGGSGGSTDSGGGSGKGGNSGKGGTSNGGAAGGTANPDLDKACTPGFELSVTDTDKARTKVFFDAIGEDPEPVVQEIGRGVCRILYEEPSEVRDATHLKLIIEYEKGGVAWKAGDGANIEVGISTDHLNNIKNQGRDVAYEIKGVLYHEMTHMYQHDDSDQKGVSIGLIEGIADFVRLHSGFPAEHWDKNKGGNWTDGYTTTAYFLDWIETSRPGFVHDLNLTMDERDNKKWNKSSFQTITGKTVETLWSEYQDTF